MLLKSITVAVALAVAVPPTPAPDTRAFPSVIMIRGGGLKQPVVIHHIYDKADPDAFRKDPIVILYSSMMEEKLVEIPAKAVEYEVAEFWGPGWVREYGKDGRPIRGLQFTSATNRSALYVTSSDVLWATQLRLDNIRPYKGLVMNAAALKVLEKAGLPKPE